MSEWYEDEECIECGELLSHTDYPEDSDYVEKYGSGAIYERVGDGETGHWCLYCRESFDSHANTLVAVVDSEYRAKVNYEDGVMFDHGSHFGEFESVADLPPAVEEAVLGIVGGTGWKSTDAWRGYEDGPSEAAGFVRAIDTWHGTMTPTDASEKINALSEGGYVDFPVIVAFTRTSNVMSQGIEVYVPEDRKADLAAFVNGASAGADGGRLEVRG